MTTDADWKLSWKLNVSGNFESRRTTVLKAAEKIERISSRIYRSYDNQVNTLRRDIVLTFARQSNIKALYDCECI